MRLRLNSFLVVVAMFLLGLLEPARLRVSLSGVNSDPPTIGSFPFSLRAQDKASRFKLMLTIDFSPAEANAAASLAASPTSVAPGGTVTASWSGITNPQGRDWLGVFALGAADTSYLAWKYVNCTQSAGSSGLAAGSCPFTAPSGNGNYELRLFANNGYTRLATSNQFAVATVTLPVVTIAVTDGTATEGSASDTGVLTVSRTGSTAAALAVNYTVSGTATNGVDYQSLPASVTIPVNASSAPITVTTIDDASVEGNETVIVTLSANAAYTLGTPASGTVTIVDNDVAAGPSLSASPTSVAPGGTVTASWSGITNPQGRDWLGVFALGAADTSYLAWKYVNCTQSAGSSGLAAGSCPFTAPSGNGNYELRLFANNGYTRLATSNAFAVASVPPLTVVSTSVPTGTANQAYSFTLTASGGITPYTWRLQSGALPTGLSLSQNGNLSGTPAAAGTSTFVVRVQDSLLAAATRSFTLTINQPLAVVTNALANGTVNQTYNQPLTASGGIPPYTWSLESGSLPAGLSLSQSGTISGTPTAVGTSAFAVRVQDSGLATATQLLGLTIGGIFSDTFDGTLANWTVVDEGTNSGPSSWVIANGELIQQSNIWGGTGASTDPVAPGTYLYAGNPAWQDYTLSLRMRSEDNDGIGVMFRYQDGQNYYRFSMNSEHSYRRLVKVVNGVTTVLSQDAVPYVVGQWYDVRVAVNGNQIQVFVDQIQVANLLDNSLAQGKIALYTWANTNAHFDDVYINDTGTFYLATNGNDNNPGTDLLPFRTLRRALLGMKRGDKLIMRQGEYRAGRELDGAAGGGSNIPSGLNASRRTKLQAYPGETVVWRTYMPDNSPVDEVTFRNGFRIFRQQDCINAYGGDGSWPTNCPGADDITKPYFAQVGFPWLEQVVSLIPAELSYVDFDGIIIDARGISGAGVTLGAANNIRFLNGEIRNSIKSCVNSAGVTNLPPSNIEFINMIVHQCGIPYDLQGRVDSKTRFWHGFYLELAGVKIDRSEIASNAGTGITVSGDRDIVVSNNIIHDHPVQGLFNGSNLGQQIYNNLFYNNVVGVQLSGPDCNTRVYNNTIIGRQDIPGANTAGMYLQPNICSQLIENNVVTGFNLGIVINAHTGSPHQLRNNLLYNNVIVGQGSYDILDYSSGRYTLSNNLIAGGYSASFVNAAAYDYTLQPASSAIDAGYPNGLTTDNDGCARPAGAGVDIGAYEYAPGCSR